MKKLIFYFLLISAGFRPLCAQTFSRSYDVDEKADNGWALTLAPAGILVTTGSICADDNLECVHIQLLHYANGDVIWEQAYNPFQERFHSAGTQSLILADDSTFILAGDRITGGDLAFYIMKASVATGDTVWYREYFNDVTGSRGITKAVDGSFVMSGQSRSPIDSILRTTLLWVGENGEEKTWKTSGARGWAPLSLDKDAQGGFILHRLEYGPGPYQAEVRLERLSPMGEVLFSIIADTVVSYSTYSSGHTIALRNGDYAMGYTFDHPLELNSQFQNFPVYVARYDSVGSLIWRWVRIEPLGYERKIHTLVEMPNGDILGVGYYLETSGPHRLQGWMFRLNSEGVLRWERYYGRDALPAAVPPSIAAPRFSSKP